jgi:hypothetical protein
MSMNRRWAMLLIGLLTGAGLGGVATYLVAVPPPAAATGQAGMFITPVFTDFDAPALLDGVRPPAPEGSDWPLAADRVSDGRWYGFSRLATAWDGETRELRAIAEAVHRKLTGHVLGKDGRVTDTGTQFNPEKVGGGSVPSLVSFSLIYTFPDPEGRRGGWFNVWVFGHDGGRRVSLVVEQTECDGPW